ncbi:uncharacterized protein N7473_010803 [Penicillium subrubescens]|uniref:uncharacterized protein n=1 Tax=Penicillium subrubescens TaxID=1316194 RepID=UPI0025453923|nr:uncharacterized protein N7473_010803 [Penicillium subrubescens]KAJ5883917.1 hypothetical protein N7473_010803 [Penicillium subrubescens]
MAEGLEPMWENLSVIQSRWPDNRLDLYLLKETLWNVLMALDYVHTERKIIHTNIKADNILVSIADSAILQQFEEDEHTYPSPRKFVGGRTIYQSRSWREPREYGMPMLTDFGAAVFGEEKHNHDAQPGAYREKKLSHKGTFGGGNWASETTPCGFDQAWQEKSRVI